jgi:adenylate cyclase
MPRLPKISPSMVWGFVILLALGVGLVTLRFGGPLQRLSFDILTIFGKKVRPEEVVLVYLDESSAANLGKPTDRPWPRQWHTQLLERLTRDGARVVFYDVFFESPGPEPGVDAAFAAAMKKHGNVVLSGLYEDTYRDGAREETTREPTPVLRDAARGWGLPAFLPLDPDNAVRLLGTGLTEQPLSSWLIAELVNAPVSKTPEARRRLRWLRYYGPSGTIAWRSFYQALDDQLVPAEFFRGKIVCIGSKPSLVARHFGEDEFANPFSRFTELYSPGLEIHATALLNLVRGDWLERMPRSVEVALAIFIALGCIVIGYGLPPRHGLLVFAGVALLLAASSLMLHRYARVWWNWLVPIGVQIPFAAAWSVGSRYAEEARRRAQLRQAFSLYLSPEMADRISDSQFDLKPGGRLVEASVLFTDCKGFTAMSEELKDAQLISNTLIAYFTETSRHVLENGGTIIKYIGDSVFACWNAPITEPDHAGKAAKTAWAMYESSKQVVLGRALTTRVGVATGEVLAGNLGSPFRFDYTAIGETVNFASRLESLNKLLGTHVLIADSTRRLVGDRFIIRPLGSFIVAGKTDPVAIHELIAPAEQKPAALEWLPVWDAAMQALRLGDFAQLQIKLREVIWQRGGADGPADFYLKYMARLEKENALREWAGIVKLTEK